MKHVLFPSAYFDSTFAINFRELRSKGYNGLLFDIDNTLTMHNVRAQEKEVNFFEHLKTLGFKTVLMSNNSKERVEPFARLVNTKYISRAQKPLSWAYNKAMDMIGTSVEDTIFIGDQLYTDIVGANRAGVKSILVHPISSKEAFWIKMKRVIEKPVIAAYEMTHKKNVITF
ncbi:MAG: YqeG family HAD IIIA-type phosphatase [Clostridiales bacterium]|nr:YqeG family HAD IIIA-type phosphatase [Clostridiales bacterium]MBS5877193.1 YqeG family HAD IIIA-type phosphatase [Clostridiales bacterium]MDU0938966.1 YqeG family HAD IIIA-type phosphatase [Clostridiales bacterium]MDU1041899.1 YqeG family HAD IIIA-type phosphatase [Clostridiales bacterium]MDU3490990.1 YqeG family HAD IIIA-type phosphatase [Clostridiales bacterium]